MGTASDYGKQLMIGNLHLDITRFNEFGDSIYFAGRVPQADQILYQTERYHGATFGYDMPVSEIKHDQWQQL